MIIFLAIVFVVILVASLALGLFATLPLIGLLVLGIAAFAVWSFAAGTSRRPERLASELPDKGPGEAQRRRR